MTINRRHLPKRWWLLGVLIVLFALALLAAKLIPTDHEHANADRSTATRKGGPQPLTFGWEYTPVRQSPVEQFNNQNLYVVNNTGCAWDVDDNSSARGDGTLAAGATASFVTCQVFDSYVSQNPPSCQTDFANARGCGQPVGARVLSPSQNLRVSVCFDAAPCIGTTHATYNKTYRAYEYAICIRAVYPYGTPLDVPIGSDGGHGILEQETLNVTNPTTHAVAKNTAWFQQIGYYQGPEGVGPVYFGSTDYCYYDNVDAQTDGTFRWTLSGA